MLESNSLIEVHRILAGQPLYAPPGVSYVPDGYPPLYFWVSAAAASMLGQSYLPLRLVSLAASLACFALLARLVQRETASACAGVAAAGVLAATYFAVGKWFDVARVDSLFLAFSVAALYAARWMRRTPGAIMAGLLLAAVFLTKQTALAEGVAVLAAVAAGPRRRLAVPAALAYGAVVGGSTLATRSGSAVPARRRRRSRGRPLSSVGSFHAGKGWFVQRGGVAAPGSGRRAWAWADLLRLSRRAPAHADVPLSHHAACVIGTPPLALVVIPLDTTKGASRPRSTRRYRR